MKSQSEPLSLYDISNGTGIKYHSVHDGVRRLRENGLLKSEIRVAIAHDRKMYKIAFYFVNNNF